MRHPRNPRGSGEKGSQHKGFRTTCIRGGYHTPSPPLWAGLHGLRLPQLISFVRPPSPVGPIEVAKGAEGTPEFALLPRDEGGLVLSHLPPRLGGAPSE